MKKVYYELELSSTDIWLNEKLSMEQEGEWVVYADNIDDDAEPIEAFKPDIDGDWQGLNGFELEDYEDELNEYTKTIEKYIRDSFSNQVNDYNHDKLVKITGINNVTLSAKVIDEKIIWVDRDYYNLHDGNLAQDKITGNTMAYMNFLCNSPVRGSGYVLVCELCNIELISEGNNNNG
jgi:hypothetical protein